MLSKTLLAGGAGLAGFAAYNKMQTQRPAVLTQRKGSVMVSDDASISLFSPVSDVGSVRSLCRP
jgi:hypothetical protein